MTPDIFSIQLNPSWLLRYKHILENPKKIWDGHIEFAIQPERIFNSRKQYPRLTLHQSVMFTNSQLCKDYQEYRTQRSRFNLSKGKREFAIEDFFELKLSWKLSDIFLFDRFLENPEKAKLIKELGKLKTAQSEINNLINIVNQRAKNSQDNLSHLIPLLKIEKDVSKTNFLNYLTNTISPSFFDTVRNEFNEQQIIDQFNIPAALLYNHGFAYIEAVGLEKKVFSRLEHPVEILLSGRLKPIGNIEIRHNLVDSSLKPELLNLYTLKEIERFLEGIADKSFIENRFFNIHFVGVRLPIYQSLHLNLSRVNRRLFSPGKGLTWMPSNKE